MCVCVCVCGCGCVGVCVCVWVCVHVFMGVMHKNQIFEIGSIWSCETGLHILPSDNCARILECAV